MRERLVAALVGITLAVITLYGVPRAYFLADLVEQQETRKLERSVDLLVVLMEERTGEAQPVTDVYLAALLNEAEGIRYVGPDGVVVTAGVDTQGDVLLERRALPGGGEVALARERALLDRRISEALTPLVVLGLGLTVLSALAGFLLARRLARPFQELAQAATALGTGRFDEVSIGHYAVPEAENIGSALRSSAEQLEARLRREREFAANASHQLRTPITALRLELEDLSTWPQTDPAVAEELGRALEELDRLGAAVTELLDLARGMRHSAHVEVDLTRLAEEVVRRWEPQLAAIGRTVVLSGEDSVLTRSDPGSIQQILDVLLENACSHGQGAVIVATLARPHYVVVAVSDEGTGTLDPDIFRRGHSGAGGTGLGLDVASQVAQALGGRLELRGHAPTTFELMLPPLPAPQTGSVPATP